MKRSLIIQTLILALAAGLLVLFSACVEDSATAGSKSGRHDSVDITLLYSGYVTGQYKPSG